MHHKNGLMVAIVIVLIIIVGAFAVMHVNISALRNRVHSKPRSNQGERLVHQPGSTWLAASGADQRRVQRFRGRNAVWHGVRYMPRPGRA